MSSKRLPISLVVLAVVAMVGFVTVGQASFGGESAQRSTVSNPEVSIEEKGGVLNLTHTIVGDLPPTTEIFYTVPAGKRVVTQWVSVHNVNGALGRVQLYNAASEKLYELEVTGTSPGIATESVSLTLEPGSTVRLYCGCGSVGISATAAFMGLELDLEADEDQDGVPNASDSCPTLAEDIDAFDDDDGCPDADNDADTFPDESDDCPATDLSKGADDLFETADDSAYPDPREDFDDVLDTDGCYDSVLADTDGDGILDPFRQLPSNA